METEMKGKNVMKFNAKTQRGEGAKFSRITHHASRNAFTLIELLVVISIIAILASMLLVAIVKMKDRARTATAKLHVQEIATAVQRYESDYHRFPGSKEAFAAALAKNEDFTYGTVGVANMPGAGNTGLGFLKPC